MSDRMTWDGHKPGSEVIASLADMKRPVLLSFSCGKDAIAAWIELRRGGVEVIPYYLYLVPGLEFVEESLRYYEQFFGAEIIRAPQPAMYRMLSNLVFQPAHRIAILQDCKLPSFKVDDVSGYIVEDRNLHRETWNCSGVRAADSPARRTNFKMLGGAMNHKRRMAYPVWDMTIEGLRKCIKGASVKLPVDYRIFGRSFDGIDFRFLYPLRKYFPRDYAKILEWFPYAEAEIKRYEYAHPESQKARAAA